jgi:hypothetical protein
VIGAGDLPGNSDVLVGGDRIESIVRFDHHDDVRCVDLRRLVGSVDELGARGRAIKIGVLRTIVTLPSWVHIHWGLLCNDDDQDGWVIA